MPDEAADAFGVQRGSEDERRRAPRIEREEWLASIIKLEGKMRKDDAYGKLRKVWGGVASRTFNDYVYAIAASRDIYIESNGSGTWLYSPKAWDEKQRTENKGRVRA